MTDRTAMSASIKEKTASTWPRSARARCRAPADTPPGARRLTMATGVADIEPFAGAGRPLRVQLKNNVVMCRVDDLDMDAIDTLIEAGVRPNRSDAAGWLIKAGLEAKRAVLDSVKDKVLEIRRIRADARALAEDAEAQQG